MKEKAIVLGILKYWTKIREFATCTACCISLGIQRKLDSTTRPTGIGYSFELRTETLRFCAIDLNSLGVLFTSNRGNDPIMFQ